MYAGLALLCALTASAASGEQIPPSSPAPSTVVQRFVDAANRRNLDAMMATLAADAVFSVLPSGEKIGSDQDAIREYYSRLFNTVKPDFAAKVAGRVEEGSFVVDREEFYNGDTRAPNLPAIWIYEVQDGLIRRAWRLREMPK